MLRSYIFGGHIAEYMEVLQDEDEEAYKRQFSQYIKNGISFEDLEDMYSGAHEAIRASPEAKKKERKPISAETLTKLKSYKAIKLNLKQRRDVVKQKIAAFQRKLAQE